MILDESVAKETFGVSLVTCSPSPFFLSVSFSLVVAMFWIFFFSVPSDSTVSEVIGLNYALILNQGERENRVGCCVMHVRVWIA
jgi:hypothetical protein